MADEDSAEAVEHEEVPGEGEGEEEEEAVEKRGADSAAEVGIDREEDQKGEKEGSAGGGLAHEGDGEAGPVKVPAVGGGRLVEQVGQADEGEEGA